MTTTKSRSAIADFLSQLDAERAGHAPAPAATKTVTVQVHTQDAAWIAAHGAGRVEDRVSVPGCTEVARHTFAGREWVSYDLPAGVVCPADWDLTGRPASGLLSALAEWVTGA
jgi:hypothetical protein